MTAIGVVVVTYNSEAEIGPCLDALQDRGDVVVIDNASTDGTVAAVEARPWARLLANPTNRGFAGGVNQGVRATKAPLVLILNPDAYVRSSLAPLADACERHGIAGGRLVGEDGRVQSGFTIRRLPTVATLSFEALGLNRIWPGNPVNRRYRYRGRDLGLEGNAEQPAGAFLMVRRDVFERVGGFDESFHPVWFEDVDFLKRAADLGVRAWYVPPAWATHIGAHSVGRIAGECRTVFWYASLLRYAAKHFRTMQFRAVCAAVAAGCLLRLVAGIIGERTQRPVVWRVVRVAIGSLWAGRLCAEGVSVEKWREGDARAVASHPQR